MNATQTTQTLIMQTTQTLITCVTVLWLLQLVARDRSYMGHQYDQLNRKALW